MTPPKRRGRAAHANPAPTTASPNNAKSANRTTEFDYDRHIVARVDESIWAALFDGKFRLALRCDRCDRWLTASKSKRAHRGPRCAAKAGDR